VPEAVARDTVTVPYNDLDAVARAFEANEGRIAAVFVEPVTGNMGVMRPVDGFLGALRDLCDRHGALLVFDEVMTGFRVNLCGASALYGVTPDLTTLGKVIGGGFPVAAYGGRRDLMERVAPEGPVYQAGTLAGNPVAMTAGNATLRALARPGVFDRIVASAERLATGLEDGCRAAGIHGVVTRVGTMLSLWFAERSPRNLEQAKATDTERWKRYFGAMLRNGVHLPPSPFEAWFVGLAHTDAVVDRVLEAHHRSLAGA
jgi:glutamate-1-semialdehyde 2,1-aminomutase